MILERNTNLFNIVLDWIINQISIEYSNLDHSVTWPKFLQGYDIIWTYDCYSVPDELVTLIILNHKP